MPCCEKRTGIRNVEWRHYIGNIGDCQEKARSPDAIRCEVEHRALGWASRSLQREFAQIIMVEVRIEEMFGIE